LAILKQADGLNNPSLSRLTHNVNPSLSQEYDVQDDEHDRKDETGSENVKPLS